MGKLPRGLPKSYIKKWGISKLAWRKFRAGALTKGIKTRTKAIKKRITRSKSSKSSKTKTNPKKVRRMVRRYRRKRRGGGGKSMTRTAFKLIRLGALAGPGVSAFLEGGDIQHKTARALARYTGYDMTDRSFDAGRMVIGWGPYLMACLATYGIPKITSIIRRL